MDHTLWDFKTNSNETLTELFHKYSLEKLGVASLPCFIKKYNYRNDVMWEQYRYGAIDRETLRNKRFLFTFHDLGIDAEAIAMKLSEDYIRINPEKNNLFPHAHKVLAYLKEKYLLHIITNGFEEVQHRKLFFSQLTGYFSEIIISERTGFKKPDKKIFFFALKKAGAGIKESIMIGDNLDVDIMGAKSIGMTQVFFNPEKISHSCKVTYEIQCLSELMNIF